MADDITLPGTGLKVDTKEQPDGSHQQVVQVDGESLTTLETICLQLARLVNTIGQCLPDTGGRLRVSLDTTSNMSTVNNVGTVATVTTVTGQTNMGGFAAADQVPALMSIACRHIRNQIQVS